MLTLPAAWLAKAEDGAHEPIYLVEIDTGKRVLFEVLDWTAGAGETAQITFNATPYTLTEGVDFVATTSNAATAEAMALAFLGALPSGVNVYVKGAKVYAIVDQADTVSSASSNSAAWDTTAATWLHKFVTGSRPFGDYDAIVSKVHPYGLAVDPIARGVPRTGEREIVFLDDGAGCPIRHLLSEYPDLRGKIVRLYLGYHGLDEADFVADGVYVISELRKPVNTPAVHLQLQDLGARLAEAKITVDVINQHPLEAAQAILDAVGVPAALYDATTLDPTAYPSIGHWCVSRHHYGFGWNGVEGNSSFITVEPRGDLGKRNARGVHNFRRAFYDRQDFGSIVEPVDALDLMNDLLQLLDGTFAPGDDGRFAFKRFDAAGTVQLELGEDDFTDLDQPEKWKSLYNHIEVKGPHSTGGSSILHQVEDLFSQHRHGLPGGAPNRRTLSLDSGWFTAVAPPVSVLASGDGAGTHLKVRHAQANGFSGLRHATAPVPGSSPATFSQDTNTTCTGSRLVYLLLFHTTDGRREVVSCNAADLDETVAPTILSGTWAMGDFTIAARGLFGTSAEDWDPTNLATANPNALAGSIEPGKILVADVTAAVDLATRKLARFSSGMPIVTLKAMPQHMALQLGDLITLDAPMYLDLGEDGAEGLIWEVIKKDPQFGGNGPGVRLTLALAAKVDTTPLLVTHNIPTLTIRGGDPPNDHSLQLDGTNDYVDYGDVDVFDNATSALWAGWVRILGSLHTADIWSRDDAGNEQFRLRVEGAEVSLEIGAGTAKSTTNDAPITLNVWHHIAVVYDGNSNVIIILVDGVKSTTSNSGSVPNQLAAPTASNLRLGAQSETPDSTYLSARVDEWMFAISFGAAFDENDAVEAYNLGQLALAGQLSFGIDHWFRFELDGDDEIGGLLGTPTGVPFFSSDTPN